MPMRPSQLVAAIAIGVALTLVATRFIQIPIPATEGYINLGDTMVLLTAVLFGPLVGAVAGGVGSALCDLTSGFAHWGPWTLIIKGTEGAIAGFFAKKRKRAVTILGTSIGAAEMVAGYFFAETIMYGVGAALTELPGNIFQGVSAIVFSNVLAYIIGRSGLLPSTSG